jgi:hypothetical protein
VPAGADVPRVSAERHRAGARPSLSQLVVAPLRRAFHGYVWRRGFLDGTQGMIIAALTAFYVLLIGAKLYELDWSRDSRSRLASLDP